MEPTHALSLLSDEPVVELLLKLMWCPNGILLWSRHRHNAGLFMDCEALVCDRLTHGETIDVVELQISQLGPHGGSQEWLRSAPGLLPSWSL